MAKVSRRSVMYGGVAAGALALLPRFSISASAQSSPESVRPAAAGLFRIMPAADPNTQILLEKLFPGLNASTGFQQLKPAAFLVTNLSPKPIRAFTTMWEVPTATGVTEWLEMHYFHPRAASRPPMHWGLKGNQTRLSGHVPIIKAGATRLMTPFFNWSTGYYNKKGIPEWSSFLKKRVRHPERLEAIHQLSGTVKMSVAAAITRGHLSYGPNDLPLIRAFRNTRNAEHDEAVAVLDLLNAGSSLDQVKLLLFQHATGKAFDITPETDLYYRVRQRQAKILLRRLTHAREDQFQRTIDYLARKKETKIRRVIA